MAGRRPFTDEFKAAHAAFEGGGFAGGFDKVAAELAKLSDDGGPYDGHAEALEALRKLAGKIAKGRKLGEQENLLDATGEYDVAKGTLASPFSSAARSRAAALKVMRHLSMLRRRGGQQVWVLALPNSYRDWPSVALAAADVSAARNLLGDLAEPFTKSDKKHMADAAQLASTWVQKALMLLASAAGTDKKAPGRPGHRGALVRRRQHAARRHDQARDGAHLRLQEDPDRARLGQAAAHRPSRGAPRHQRREREVLAVGGLRQGRARGHEVIYIESGFFAKKGSNTLYGLKNWARILVHELSHREVRTVDKFYSWEGLRPDAGSFPMIDCIFNADSWAFFCVDAAGALSTSERNTALV